MYHPSPDETPVDSATSRVRNDAPSPMNSPLKMLGMAAGRATLRMRYRRPAPSVRATSRYDARTLEIPDALSMVTGNQTASAIRNTPAEIDCGKITSAIGIHAVAGMGPTIFSNGIPQYLALPDHPMVIPLTSPERVPREKPSTRSTSECQVLSKSW